MPVRLSARFMRVGSHLINIEAIQQVYLKSDESAVLSMTGPRKSLQLIPVPSPYGRELWNFVQEHLVVVEFGDQIDQQQEEPGEQKDRRRKKADQPRKNSKHRK